jgi:flagellar basal body-associated protein FliL
MVHRTGSDNRRGIALVPVLAIVGAVVVAAACAAVVAFAMTGGPPEQGGEAAPPGALPKAEDESVFISFGEAFANLSEDRLTRYVKVKVTLQVGPTSADGVQDLMGGPKKAVFSNWLITYLSDKQLQDVKGATAMNRVRREILDGFNAILAEQGDLKVERVLFEEFNVQ